MVAASDGYELDAAEQLASVGLPVRGYLHGGHDRLALGGPAGAADRDDRPGRAGRAPRRQPNGLVVLDVRDADEFEEGHIPDSVHIPFGELPERSGELPRDGTIAAVCSGGKRSGLAASLLQREGFERVLHVADGGVGTWEREGRPIVKRILMFRRPAIGQP